MKRQNILLAVVIPGALAISTACAAQTPPASRTILQRAPVATSPVQETILATVNIAPRTGNPPHFHNGSEMAVVIEGRIQLNVQGQPSRTLGPGESFYVPRGVIHNSTPLGDVPVKLVNTWTVDKGGELLIPASPRP